eukprot:9111979-Alexandrium_andersonii.AAC.1
MSGKQKHLLPCACYKHVGQVGATRDQVRGADRATLADSPAVGQGGAPSTVAHRGPFGAAPKWASDYPTGSSSCC